MDPSMKFDEFELKRIDSSSVGAFKDDDLVQAFPNWHDALHWVDRMRDAKRLQEARAVTSEEDPGAES